jgi:hypothetical protein
MFLSATSKITASIHDIESYGAYCFWVSDIGVANEKRSFHR